MRGEYLQEVADNCEGRRKVSAAEIRKGRGVTRPRIRRPCHALDIIRATETRYRVTLAKDETK